MRALHRIAREIGLMAMLGDALAMGALGFAIWIGFVFAGCL